MRRFGSDDIGIEPHGLHTGEFAKQDFDWQGLFERLGESEEEPDFGQQAEVLRRVIMAITDSNPGKRIGSGYKGRRASTVTAVQIGRRALAIAFMLRVPVMDKQSLASLAAVAGVSKQAFHKEVRKIRDEILGKFHRN